MTDQQEEFRLSGAVSVPLTTDEINELGVQVITQGIGFPLRAVSNAPPDGTGEVFNDESVASGSFMQYINAGWQSGKFFAKGSVVANGVWQMVANTLTLDPAFPILGGDSNWGSDTFTPTTENNVSVVESGSFITVNETLYVGQIRVWVPVVGPDVTYRLGTVFTNAAGQSFTSRIELPNLTAGEWNIVGSVGSIVAPGSTAFTFLISTNSQADSEVTGPWRFSGNSNNGLPTQGNWNADNASLILRINKLDANGSDRAADLATIGFDDTVVFSNPNVPEQFNEYRINGPIIDNGGSFSWASILVQAGTGGVGIGLTDMVATIPVAQATEYSEQAGVLPSYTQDVVVEGRLAYDGVLQSGGELNTYGIDVNLESIEASPDWDVLSLNTN